MNEKKTDQGESAPLNRRQVLSAGLGLATASAVGHSSPEPAANAARDFDVIVIGAGFCGVAAARECHRAGHRVLILEARNRIGGRTCVTQYHGRVAELGGTWVHWSQPYVWSEINRFGLALSESSGATPEADKIIVRTSSDDIVTLSNAKVGEDIAKAMARYMGDTRALLPRPMEPFSSDAYKKVDGISSLERLSSIHGMPRLYRDIVDAYQCAQGHTYGDHFAWLEMVRWYSIPGHNFDDEGDATGRYLLAQGTSHLLELMLKEAQVELQLGTPATVISQDSKGVTVLTRDGREFHGRALVSTIPLNVLKDVEWRPNLSEAKLQASTERHAGSGSKAHIVLEGDHGNFTGYAPGRNPINWLNTQDITDGDTHVIAFGPDPAILNVNDAASVQKAVRLFLPDARVKDCMGYEWDRDPYSKGTWCTLRPGQWSKYLHELQQPQGRVVFASADWANGWRGFIDGAIEQGVLAGRQVRELLI